MADLKDVELFKVGRWNGMSFDVPELDEIASNFALLEQEMRVPLKLGHNGKSKDQLAGSGIEQPALGFVENVRRVGGKLIADFRDVPSVVKNAIAKRLYSGLSIELLGGVRYKGKDLRYVLDAVALLGATQPAVSGLKDLATYLASRQLFEDEGERLVFEFEDPGIDETKVAEMIAAAVEPIKAENEDLRKQLDAEKKRSAKFEREQQDSKAEAVKERRAKAESVIEQAVKDNRILPAQRETFTRLFQLDDDTVVMRDGLLEEIESAFNGPTRMAFTTTEVGYSDPQSFERERDVFAETDRRTKKIMAAQGLDYRNALYQVFQNDPGLHREYLETDTPEQVA